MIFRGLNDKRIKPEHYPVEIVADIDKEVQGARGVAFATEKENALLILKENVETPTTLRALIADKKVIVASDGNAVS